MNGLAKEGLFESLKIVSIPIYESCFSGEVQRKPFGKALRASYIKPNSL